jgi:hypothetical protein
VPSLCPRAPASRNACGLCGRSRILDPFGDIRNLHEEEDMQQLRTELERARVTRDGASDVRARAALDGVILALEWAIEDEGRAPPSDIAAGFQVAPKPRRKS